MKCPFCQVTKLFILYLHGSFLFLNNLVLDCTWLIHNWYVAFLSFLLGPLLNLPTLRDLWEREPSEVRTSRSSWAALMASGIVVNLQQEVTCPICLELLTEPLSLDCGHSFCQACITANNMVSMNDQDEDRRCPVCRISYEPGNLRPNRHVANIVQRLREVKLSPEVEQERNLCLHHGEKLMLFCEEDREVICWLCARSQEHHGHHTFLMEEVAQDYQVRE